MPGAKYEQLSLKSDADEDVFTTKPKPKWSEVCVQKSLLSLGLILLYFSLSIGLTFYQRWLLTDFKFPLTVVMYHLIVKWMLSVVVRLVLQVVTGSAPLLLPCMTCLRSVGPTGLASGIDVGFSNWGLELVTISLYTMTKSTTIIFILGFAILLGLEKKSWSLVGIVLMIAAGLIMFTYKATQFNLLGFNFLLLASFAAGLRWTFAQLLMQKSKLGLHNPVDMVFHVQPWMFVSLLPFTIMFEGNLCASVQDKNRSSYLM
ncbi:solute carrier family 35 member C2-like isoform X2 [Trichoplusia ni]|uniref:Solute carrier family 35 member C2-like isoform X2 n=1 Tax=Trichoplusia ni TaxID=7111 RepID=A0A7E5W6V2_TRINI|nr:solute carrier family 35 member C2-like isoform X2 [Trichoplusia ni]